MGTKQKAKWYGPKQIGIMLYTGIMMLFSTCILTGNTNTVFPVISELRGWNTNPLVISSSVAAIIAALSCVFITPLCRKKCTNIMGIGLLISAIGMLIWGRTTNIAVFCIIILLFGFCACLYSSAGAMVLTANWWPTKKGVVLGWTTMGILLMQIIYVPYIPVAIQTIGMPMTFTIFAVILVVFALLAFTVVKDTPEDAGTTPDGMQGVDLDDAKAISKALQEYKSPFTLGKLVKDKNNWFISLGLGLCGCAAMGYISSTIPALLSYGYDYTFATTVFAVGGVIALVGSWLFGVIDTAIGTKKASSIYAVISAVSLVCAIFMKTSPVFVWISAIILFAGNGALQNLLPSYVGSVYGRWDYPAAYRMLGTVFRAFLSAGIMLMALVSNYTAMYILCLVLTLIGLVLLLLSNDKFIGKAG